MSTPLTEQVIESLAFDSKEPNATAETSKLAALHDYFLPRLLSGRVRVRDVANVGEV